MSDAIGMVETVGLVGVIEAGDAMAKAASVQLLGWDKVGSGLVTVFCSGDVASTTARVWDEAFPGPNLSMSAAAPSWSNFRASGSDHNFLPRIQAASSASSYAPTA